MALTVSERGTAVATFRFVEVFLMETAAAWIPTTPETEVKVLLGRHVWDFAQHADALGRRTFELRLPAQQSRPPAPDFLALLQDVRGLAPTAERLSALYDVVLPGLGRRYGEYLQRTDTVLDGPTVVILEGVLADLARQRTEVQHLRNETGLAAPPLDPLRARETATPGLVA